MAVDISQELLQLDEYDPHTHSPIEVAKLLKRLHSVDEEKFIEYINILPTEILGEIYLELPDDHIKYIIENTSVEAFADAVKELESDDQTDLIQNLEDINIETAQEVFEKLDIQDQADITRLKKYDDKQAGAYMQTELLNVAFDNTVQDAINRLKEGKANGKLENIHQLFVTGVYDRLLLAIPLEDLITLDFETSFRDLFPAENEKFRPRYIHDDEDIQKVASLFEEYDLSVIAVTDYYGKLLGRITSDDIYDIMQERSTEQLYHLAGLDDEAEEEDNLLEAGKKRGSWLFINLLTAILASIVIGMFDETLQKYVALAILMPIVASMGGNAGTQTLTVVVRQLALGVIRIEDARSTIKKEVFLSFGNGIIFSLLMGSIAYFWFNEPLIGLVIAMSMVVNLLFAGFFGAIIPLLLKRFHIDPAVGSTVLLTTVTDVVGFLSFLGFAKLILV